MDINNKMLMDLAEELGVSQKGGNRGYDSGATGNDEELKRAAKRAESYKDKSDQELVSEIMALKEAIKNDRKAYDQQMKAIRALRPMMSGEQKARLDKIIQLLES